VSGIWSRKLYDSNDLYKQNQNCSTFEQKGSEIQRFRNPERSDVGETLLKWISAAVSGPVLMTL